MENKTMAVGKAMVFICVMAMLLFGMGPVSWAQGLPWRYHAAPYDFMFGNHIDTHQQSKLVGEGLQGFLYITYIGEFNGVPVAEHCDEDTDPALCVVGWKFTGKFIDPGPTFVFHQDDHPIWLVASRNDIPQPGAYSHFHWYGSDSPGTLVVGESYPGYFLELFAVRTFYFKHENDMILVKSGLDIATHVNIVGSFPDF